MSTEVSKSFTLFDKNFAVYPFFVVDKNDCQIQELLCRSGKHFFTSLLLGEVQKLRQLTVGEEGLNSFNDDSMSVSLIARWKGMYQKMLEYT